MSDKYDALLIGDPRSPWGERTASILDRAGLAHAAAPSAAQAKEYVTHADVVLFHVEEGADPLVEIAALWGIRAQVPVILLGDDIDDALRGAAFEAGIAHVTRAAPPPEELLAMLRVAVEQSRVGSPELVRAMCRTMCALSTVVASAKDTSFLDATVLQVSALFQAPVVSIMLFDDTEADPPLRIAAQVGLGAAVLYGQPQKGGVAERVARAREPRIILRDAGRSEPFEGVRGRSEITASMCVPIPSGKVAGARPRGVINVAKTRPCAVFTPRDLDVCVSIAGLIGDALTMIEAREAQAMMEQRLAAVERLSTIGEIAGGIAHEVANPIACVRSNVDTMIEYMKELAPALAELDDREELKAILDDMPAILCEIWEGLRRTDEVVRQMKRLVRLNGKAGRDERVPLAPLVEDTVRLLKPRIRVPVRLELQRDLCVQGSTVELSQVLVNLVVNAADACDERRVEEAARGGSHEAEVRIAVAAEGGQACIHVVDNGVGMSPEVMKKIFMPLFTTKPGERGTGLGLSIVRRVIEEHGGHIDVHSTPGSGSAFVITLPLLGAPADACPPIDNMSVS